MTDRKLRLIALQLAIKSNTVNSNTHNEIDKAKEYYNWLNPPAPTKCQPKEKSQDGYCLTLAR